ncbi:chorismate mutase [Saccharomycopsis crataegensis]|uniref:Chorismate mutase n=1 Tax=Saccharomycopsis crataegensis TaxID=43959 RepID=A0AAV5QVA7_9ASCO|nr:chorismate mutase [Saccharomycopsis crataegensis]
MDFLKPETVLDLSNIRSALVRMEDTIIFNFIERSQFFSTPSIYEPNRYPIPNFNGSFVEYALLQKERSESQLRRFQAPDEHSFFPASELCEPILSPINYPKILASYNEEINVNDEIKEYYINNIAPVISVTQGEQQENLGSCTLCDIDCLQALSRRIHFGKFVAESKFINDREAYTIMIKNKDAKGLEAAITNAAVEEKILQRLTEKAVAYGTDPLLRVSQNQQSKVRSDVLVSIYKNWVIPLTRKVEVDYLLRRLEDDY